MEFLQGSGDNSSDEDLNCTLLYDSANFRVLAGLRASVGLISFLACAAVVVIIFLFKKYRFFSQRLILNVAVAATIHSFSYTTARVNYYTVRPIDDPYCYFGGLLNHYTAAVELISIWFTTVNIFSVGMCGKNISKFEPVYYVVTYALPLLWFWVPVYLRAYGTSGGWCGIKTLQADCTPFEISRYIQLGIWFIPLYISTAIILLMLIVVAIKYCRAVSRWKGKFDAVSQEGQKTLRNELRTLISYPIIYLLLSTFSFISLIYRAAAPSSPSPVLPYFRVLTSPLRGAFIALAFALDKNTRSRLTVAHCRAVCLECVQKQPQAELMESTTLYSEREESINYDSSKPEYNRFLED